MPVAVSVVKSTSVLASIVWVPPLVTVLSVIVAPPVEVSADRGAGLERRPIGPGDGAAGLSMPSEPVLAVTAYCP